MDPVGHRPPRQGRDNGAHSQWNYDPNTGYPNTFKDAVGVQQSNAATAYTYATTDSADSTLSGHIAFLTDVTSPLGRRTHYIYYPLSPGDPGYVSTPGYAGNLETAQAPDGTAAGAAPNSYLTTYTYDLLGQVYSVKDADGNTTTFDRTFTLPGSSTPFPEPTGQPRTVLDPLLNSTNYVYGPRGEVTRVTDPLGHVATRNYDVFLRPLDSTVPKDSKTGTTVTNPAPVYDVDDNITQSTAPVYTGSTVPGAVTAYAFDKDDRTATVTLPPNGTAARVITYGYDNVGNQTSLTQPLGNPAASPPTYTTLTHYNAVDAPDWTTDAATHKTQFGYDDVGNRTSVTDPRNNTTQAKYDFDHRRTGTVDAANNTTAVGFDADGVKTSTTDQNGTKVAYPVDSDGQVTQVQVPHSPNSSGTATIFDYTQFTYDQVGNDTSVISPKGVSAGSTGPTGPFTTSAKYDADNRKSKVFGAFDPTDPFYTQSQQPETDYSYDADSRITQVDRLTQPIPVSGLPTPPVDHAVTKLGYFDNGWTKSSSDPFNITATYDYNARGQQVTRELATGDTNDKTSTGLIGAGSAQRFMNWSYYGDGSLQNYQDTGTPNGWQDETVTADSGTTQLQASWNFGPNGAGYGGSTYASGTQNKFTWNLSVPQDGTYTVYVWYSVAGSPGADYTVNYNGGSTPAPGIQLDQTKNVGTWVSLGTYNLKSGATGQSVTVQPAGGGVAPTVADSVRIVRDNSKDPQPTGPNSFTYQYDANGSVSDIADASPTAKFDDYTPTFNTIDQLSQLQEKKAGVVQHTLTYGYDPAGNLASQTQDAVNGSFGYDPLNQLSQVTNKQSSTDPGIVTKYTYYPNGQLHTETKGNGNLLTDSYNYDGTLSASTEVAAGTIVDNHILGYDANNNITSDAATVQNADAPTTAFTRTSMLTYSPNDQVTSVKNGQDDQSYQYNSSGAVSTQTVGGAQASFGYWHGRVVSEGTASGATGTYEYDTMGRLHDVVNGYFTGSTTGVGQEYRYDGYDNILSQSSTDATGKVNTDTYTYDSLNRALSEAINPGVSGAPAQNETIDYVGTTKTVADENISVPNVTDVKTYDYAPSGERLALLDSTTSPTNQVNQNTYYTYNQHQDVEALTGQNGSNVQTYGYTAYGADDKTLASGSDKGTIGLAGFPYNSFRFNSGKVSTSTGNLDMGFRTYDPNINSFVSRDMFSGAGADSELAASSALGGRYGFAGGNPISNIEQDGHDWKTWLVVGFITAAVVGGIACTIITAGGCLAVIGEAALAGAEFGAESSIIAAGTQAIIEGGAAVYGSLAAGGVAGAAAAGLAAVGEDVGAAGGADAGAADVSLGQAALRTCGGESFSADTKVQLADGASLAISTLKPGDKVKSTDTATGKTKDSATSAVLVKHDTDLYDLTVHTAKGDRVVHTTAHHLFYDRTSHRWVEAARLPKGDQLTTDDGATATVVGGATPAKADGDMWDLTVPGDHDFYVEAGDTPILVHNCDPAALAATAKQLAEDVHAKIPNEYYREARRTTAVTVAEREDGSIVYVVSGSGGGLERAQKDYIDSIATLDEQGRPDIVAATNVKGAHAEPNGVHYVATNDLKPIAGGVVRNSCKPDGCEDFLGQVGAQMVGPVTPGGVAKVPGQSMYIWSNYEKWDYFLVSAGYI